MIKRLTVIIPALILIGVAFYFILTTAPLVRYWADDFCYAIPLRVGGFWVSQINWWKGWTGRYSSTFFLNVFEMIGPYAARVLPILIACGMILPFFVALSFEMILAPLFVVLALVNTPNLIQSFYWQAGSLNYAAEFIFFNFFVLIVIRSKSKVSYLAAILLPFIAGGFSESYGLIQIILIFFIFLILLIGDFQNKKLKVKLVVAGLLGAVASLGVMFFSPGNVVRSSLVTQPSSLMFVIKSTFYGTKWYISRMFMIKPFVISLVLLLSAVFITVEKNWKIFRKMFFGTGKMILIMFLSILSAIFSTMMVIFSGYYAMSITPPERAMFLAVYAILFSFFVFSFAGSILIHKFANKTCKRYLNFIIVAFYFSSVTFLVLSTTFHWNSIRKELENYAHSWDFEERILVNAKKEEHVEIDSIKPVGGLDGFVENEGWVLGCVRQYYGLKEIRLK